jgi:heme/copper-type cytochrome/quinol oxidase subunit 2
MLTYSTLGCTAFGLLLLLLSPLLLSAIMALVDWLCPAVPTPAESPGLLTMLLLLLLLVVVVLVLVLLLLLSWLDGSAGHSDARKAACGAVGKAAGGNWKPSKWL